MIARRKIKTIMTMIILIIIVKILGMRVIGIKVCQEFVVFFKT